MVILQELIGIYVFTGVFLRYQTSHQSFKCLCLQLLLPRKKLGHCGTVYQQRQVYDLYFGEFLLALFFQDYPSLQLTE